MKNIDPHDTIVSVAAAEPILRHPRREISILLARDEVTITHARYAADRPVAGPHVHHEQTDAFCVLDGELIFEVGREIEAMTVSAGGFVAVPPGLAHSFRTAGSRPSSWLTIHAPDGGFAAFMRGLRHGVDVESDISAAPAGADCQQAPRSPAVPSSSTPAAPSPDGRKPPRALQGVIFGVLAPVARWRGYRATCPQLFTYGAGAA